ncbi:hypothetical protein J6590_001933 [Homalodisca vitripennis]|nr:hypothetical protein J6590_001933 [Homalodisca vitripennis]
MESRTTVLSYIADNSVVKRTNIPRPDNEKHVSSYHCNVIQTTSTLQPSPPTQSNETRPRNKQYPDQTRIVGWQSNLPV